MLKIIVNLNKLNRQGSSISVSFDVTNIFPLNTANIFVSHWQFEKIRLTRKTQIRSVLILLT